jgi:hypothetical protein
MPIVTVSRQMGAGADWIIAEVSRQLGLSVVDRTVVGRAALAAGVPSVAFQELAYEGERNLVQRMLQFMNTLSEISSSSQSEQRETLGPFSLPFGGAFAPSVPPAGDTRVTLERYVAIVGNVIRDFVQRGGVLIVGLGGQAVLRDDPRVLHVQIIAQIEDRVQRFMAREKCQRGDALRRLRVSDDARSQYVHKHYGIEWLDPLNYHMTITSSKMSLECAVAAIVAAAQQLDSGSETTP